MKETMENLTEATRELTAKVAEMDKHLAISRKQTNKLRWLVVGVAVVAVFSLVACVAVGLLYRDLHQAVDDNTANAVTNCENANQSREANRILWGYVLDVSAANGEQGDDERDALLASLRGWINELYESRDCQDLSRKYPLPPPPALPGE